MSYFPPTTITFEAAVRDVRAGSPRARAAAAAALGDTAPEQREEAVAALVPALDDLSIEVRAAAASSLGELGGAKAVEALVRCLTDGAPIVRQTAAISLGRIGDPAAFEPLAEALRDGTPDLRFQAATSLVEVDPERAYEPLVAALADRDGEVLGAAALSLGAIGRPEARDRIATLLDHSRAATRFDAAYALARLGDSRGAGVLAEGIDRGDVAWDAIESLELLATDAAVSALAGVLAKPRAAREVRLRAAAALLNARPDHSAAGTARAELLESLSAWWKPDLRGLAIQELGRVGGGWAADALRELGGRWSARKLGDEIGEALRRIEAREKAAP